jgi:ketosteroid isomerase-like protein
MASRMTPLEAIRAVFGAWERGDPDALRELFCADGVYLDPLKAGPLEGQEAIVEGNRPAMAAITECQISERCAIDADDRAMVEGFFSSRIAAGEGRLDFAFMAVAEMREGRIRRLAEYFDTRPLQ